MIIILCTLGEAYQKNKKNSSYLYSKKGMEENMKKSYLFILGISIIALLAGGCNKTKSNENNDPAINDYQAEITLHQDMRKLWTDHVVWTRIYIIAAVNSSADAEAVADRLLKNQEDIGDAVASYYGNDAGDKLTELLKEHILIAVDLIKAAKVKNQEKFNETNTKWKKNGQEIADFLSSANPKNWPQQTMRDMMNEHLATTTDEVTARLDKQYEDDIKAYDAVYDHILAMADALSDGIIKQFPDKFK